MEEKTLPTIRMIVVWRRMEWISYYVDQ